MWSRARGRRRRSARPGRAVAVCAVVVAGVASTPRAAAAMQLRYDREYPSVGYSTREPRDRVSLLRDRLATGAVALEHAGDRGYLEALLEALEIPVSSQMLVFTRTSLQANLISPERPRAIYFNDDAYVAFVQGADVFEISAVDPVLGGVFYTLPQDPDAPAELVREDDMCLQCHDSYGLTGGGVPRYLVGSMLPDENGQSVYHEGWQLTDDRTPLERRWGGWYVTGTHGDMIHRGNAIVAAPASPEEVDLAATGNRETLDGLVDTDPYPTGHSDIVALMVLEHQVRVQNEIIRVGYDVRTALHRDRVEGRTAPAGGSGPSAETLAVVERVGEPLVRALLLAGEAPLEDRVVGGSGFARDFERRGLRDAEGRSLRDLDLRTRLFRYPLSYMIHSAAFEGLPLEARTYVYRRLREVLGGSDRSEAFARLGDGDREAILEILTDTKPEFRAGR